MRRREALTRRLRRADGEGEADADGPADADGEGEADGQGERDAPRGGPADAASDDVEGDRDAPRGVGPREALAADSTGTPTAASTGTPASVVVDLTPTTAPNLIIREKIFIVSFHSLSMSY